MLAAVVSINSARRPASTTSAPCWASTLPSPGRYRSRSPSRSPPVRPVKHLARHGPLPPLVPLRRYSAARGAMHRPDGGRASEHLRERIGPSQPRQGEEASQNPDERDAGEDQLVVHEEVDRQGDTEDEQESPEPASARGWFTDDLNGRWPMAGGGSAAGPQWTPVKCGDDLGIHGPLPVHSTLHALDPARCRAADTPWSRACDAPRIL